MSKLIVVSNAEPYEHIYRGSKIRLNKRAGGLTTGVNPMMLGSDNIWIAWGRGEADFEVVDGENKVVVPDKQDGYALKRVDLSSGEVNGFYYGFSNEALWPICHTLGVKLQFTIKNIGRSIRK